MALPAYLMKCTLFSAALRGFLGAAVALLLVSLPFPSAAPAQRNDAMGEFGLGSGQVRITADQLIADSEENSAEFIGNVKAVQEDTVITSDRLKIFFKKGVTETKDEPAPDALVKIVIKGNVEIKFDNRVAVTQEAVYIAEDQRLILSGPNSKIISGKDTISGERITYFRDKGRIQVEAGRGGRVEAVIYPSKK
jgi:lipopolysaccharide export system protein LptA